MKRGGELVGGEDADTHTAPVAEAGGLQQAQAPALTVCWLAGTHCCIQSLVKHGIMLRTTQPDIMPALLCSVHSTMR